MPLVIVVAAFLIFLPTRAAFADGCTDLGGVVVGAECLISGDVGEKSGTYNLEQSLRVGIKVSGIGNHLQGGKVVRNFGDGLQFSATAEGNVLRGATVRANGGNGILVEGSGNKIVDNPRVDSNTKNGVLVTGSGNLIKKNVAGSDKTTGNGENGFKVMGNGNTLDSNKSSANLGDGFTISGGTAGNPNALKGNQSNVGGSGQNKENQGAEYRLANIVKSLDGNKADGASVPKTDANVLKTKCPEFPKKNEPKDFPTPFVCE